MKICDKNCPGTRPPLTRLLLSAFFKARGLVRGLGGWGATRTGGAQPAAGSGGGREDQAGALAAQAGRAP